MANYTVYITHSFEDSVNVEAASYDEALDIGEELMRGKYSVLSNDGGYTMPWDEVSAYEAHEEEE
mgnify:CR=1 FL=1